MLKILARSSFLFSSAVVSLACAHGPGIYRPESLQPLEITEITKSLKPGSTVVIGEVHGVPEVAAAEIMILNSIRSAGLDVQVGMEFLNFTDQAIVDNYRQGALNEDEFLKAVGWGTAMPYSLYRDQILFPAQGVRTWALNAPPLLSKKIAKSGLASLDSAEKELLPPNFTIGRDSYKRRFFEQNPHIPNPALGENFFVAQSLWDDTMAWKASQAVSSDPQKVLAIIVGEFHVQYGGGLPDRLNARGVSNVVTVSIVNCNGFEEKDYEEVLARNQDGVRANFVWFVSIKDQE